MTKLLNLLPAEPNPAQRVSYFKEQVNVRIKPQRVAIQMRAIQHFLIEMQFVLLFCFCNFNELFLQNGIYNSFFHF